MKGIVALSPDANDMSTGAKGMTDARGDVIVDTTVDWIAWNAKPLMVLREACSAACFSAWACI